MKCEHCGYDAPERAVICPECGEILPRETEKKATAKHSEKSEIPLMNSYAMPFLSAESTGNTDQTTEDPHEMQVLAREKRSRLMRRLVGGGVAVILIVAVILYSVFLGGYKLAAYRYIKGVDRSSGSMYVALVPDAYMDYLESTYDTTRREVKQMVKDYFTSWNSNYGTEGGMSYEFTSKNVITDEDDLDELEEELKTSYGISVEIKKAVSVKIALDDGGQSAAESARLVKIGQRWCCMEAMEQINYICENDGYNEW